MNICDVWRRPLLLSCCLFLAGCGPFLDEMAERRSEYARAAEGPVVVAVINDRPKSQFVNGARLAVDEINASRGKLMGRPVELMVRDGSDRFSTVRSTVHEIASDPRVTAVLGHNHPDVAVPASVVYEQANVLFMAPVLPSQLTWHGFEFVLRMLPTDETMSEQLASVASLFGYQTLAVLHSHDEQGRKVAFMVVDAADRHSIEVVFRGAFFAGQKDYRQLISELIGVDVDAVAVFADADSVAQVLRQLRELNLTMPVLSGYTPNPASLAGKAGAAGDKLIIPVAFTGENRAFGVQRFTEAYFESYGCGPDQTASQGYDSIKILKTLIERAGTTEPRTLVMTTRYSGPIAGISGVYQFNPQGDVYGRDFQFQVLRGGRWWALPGAEAPFLLSRFKPTAQRDRGAAAVVPNPEWSPAQLTPAAQRTGSTEQPSPIEVAGPDKSPSQRGSGTATVPSDESGPVDLESLGLDGLANGGADQWRREKAWFSLVHELLGFSRLGMVVSSSDLSKIAELGLARTMAKQRGFELELCVPGDATQDGGIRTSIQQRAAAANAGGVDVESAQAAGASEDKLQQSVQRCYSRLSRTVDAIFVTDELDLSPAYVKELNQGLLYFDVASFALGEAIDTERGLSLVVGDADVDLTQQGFMTRFDGLLKDTSAREINRRIEDTPAFGVDLGALSQLGIRLPPRALALVSDVLGRTPIDTEFFLAPEME